VIAQNLMGISAKLFYKANPRYNLPNLTATSQQGDFVKMQTVIGYVIMHAVFVVMTAILLYFAKNVLEYRNLAIACTYAFLLAALSLVFLASGDKSVWWNAFPTVFLYVLTQHYMPLMGATVSLLLLKKLLDGVVANNMPSGMDI
jgi:hypothetical protein